jgi:hypothetical protein
MGIFSIVWLPIAPSQQAPSQKKALSNGAFSFHRVYRTKYRYMKSATNAAGRKRPTAAEITPSYVVESGGSDATAVWKKTLVKTEPKKRADEFVQSDSTTVKTIETPKARH